MTRKRFVKLMRSHGFQRDSIAIMVRHVQGKKGNSYQYIYNMFRLCTEGYRLAVLQ